MADSRRRAETPRTEARGSALLIVEGVLLVAGIALTVKAHLRQTGAGPDGD